MASVLLSAQVAATAPARIRDLIGGPERPADVLGRFATALYLRLADGEVIAVLSSDAVGLPIGLILPTSSREFPLTYLEFKPPFSSRRYLEALQAAADRAEGGVVVLDSTSHEHEGEGGYLELHESELDRMAGTDWKKRERMTFACPSFWLIDGFIGDLRVIHACSDW